VNISQYNFLKFSLHIPEIIEDAEVKLESPLSNAAIFLKDYAGEDVGEGFVEYTIPMSDFAGLETSGVTIPFALWNPIDSDGGFPKITVLIDNIYFVE
jgi:hypothetical protein